MAAPDAPAVRALAEFLSSRRAIKAKRLPTELVRAIRDLGVRESAARTAGRIALGMPLPGRGRNGAPVRYDGMSLTRAVAAEEPEARARYIIAAARRLSEAADEGTLASALKVESTYSRMHLQAGRKRRAAAAVYDATAARSKTGWMVWRAQMDARTTPDCAALNGRLFRVSNPPGVPGAMHPRCRCTAQPWGGAHPEI